MVEMARSRKITFGPGRLEDVELRMWARPRTEGRAIVAEIRGWAVVYCGNGSVHYPRVCYRVETELGNAARVRERYAANIADMSIDVLAEELYVSGARTETDEAYELAGYMLGDALEDWRDPCELECSECGEPATVWGDGEFERFCSAHAPADLTGDDL